ncbi:MULTISPECIES: hypothetical protein [unclassified Streptomyces]|uniref:hypothetical protein n=1 Tax=unclassified Streptomyces TaxID=2593676 RepID=UPI00081F7025|nr:MULTISPECIES: hypothetical protein [unclassified Streptomyces]MYZ38349.1 hypothetical protein [Streptomyces sp. SID4917]SCF97908.1 hypothetical protein GA0115259_1062110 [Streptomyces sp. MnatMP-M17]
MLAATGAPFSRRRAILITLGAGWAGYGALGILANPRAGTTQMLDVITRWVPLSVLGWLWVTAGTVAIVAGMLVRCPRWQAAGFTGLAALAGLWAAAFTTAVPKYPTASGSACIWVALALAIVWLSGLDDPPPAHLRKGAEWT